MENQHRENIENRENRRSREQIRILYDPNNGIQNNFERANNMIRFYSCLNDKQNIEMFNQINNMEIDLRPSNVQTEMGNIKIYGHLLIQDRQDPLNDNIITSVTKLINEGYKQNEIINDNVNSSLKIKSKSNNIIIYVNYNTMINKIHKFKTNYPVYKPIFTKYSKKFSFLFKYGFDSTDNNSNEHFPYHSIRGLSEFINNHFLSRTFLGYTRITMGENIARSQYFGGLHFLSPEDEYDRERILKYINTSYTPSQNIIPRRLNQQNLDQLVRDRNLNRNRIIICSTDSLYYNPFISNYFAGVQSHNFNVFNIKEGNYIIDNMVSYKVIYKNKIFANNRFLNPNNNDVQIPIKLQSCVQNQFVQNTLYSIPYIEMKVEGNPKPYVHPAPIINGYIIDIDLINKIKRGEMTLNNLYFKINLNIKINQYLYYVSVIYNNTDEPQSLYDQDIDLQEEEAKEVSVDFLGEMGFMNYLNNKEYIQSNQKLKCVAIKEDDDFMIIGGEIIKFYKNIINYKKITSLLERKYYFDRKEVAVRVDMRYLNHGLTQYRSGINDKTIKSCASALLRLSETEENIQKINFFEADTIAKICAKLSNINNISNEILSQQLTHEKDEMISDVNKQINRERLIKKVNKGIDIADAINESLKDAEDKINKSSVFLKYFFGFSSIQNYVKYSYGGVKKFINGTRDLVNGDHSKYEISDLINYMYDSAYYYVTKGIQYRSLIYSKMILFILMFISIFIHPYLFIIFSLLYTLINFKNEFISISRDVWDILCHLKKIFVYSPFKNTMRTFPLRACYFTVLYYIIMFSYYVLEAIYYAISDYTQDNLANDFIMTVFIILFILSFMIFIPIYGNNFLCRMVFVSLAAIIQVLSYKFGEKYSNYWFLRIFRFISFFYNYYNGNVISFINTTFYSSTKLYKMLGVKSSFIYECGTCTLNNVEEMINFLTLMYNYAKNKTPYSQTSKEIQNKYNKETFGKFKILKLPKDLKCNHTPESERQFLVNFGFQINGYNVEHNTPLKLHRCRRNEMESIYRQVQSGITYNKDIVKDFVKFAHKRIDSMVDEYYSQNIYKELSLQEYYQKLGAKRHEYEEGYKKYCDGGKLELTHRMHNKDDEKQYLNFNDFKSKSRNICAQLPMGKILLGIVCELGMDVLHSQEWCGPGSNYKKRCEKYSNWIKEIDDCGAISCDGSSFDSTQHAVLIQQVDVYFLKRILKRNSYLNSIYNPSDVEAIIEQKQFTIWSPYGFVYRIIGTQLSGRMSTCLGNTLRSSLYIRYSLYKMKIENKSYLVNFEVNGDDQIIFMNNKLIPSYIQIAKKYVYATEDSNKSHGLGQICKLFDVYPEITGAEYLSCYFIYSNKTNKIWLVRKPERFFQLIPFTFRIGTRNKNRLEYQRTVLGHEIVEGALHENNGVELYNKLLIKYEILLNDKLKQLKKNFNYKFDKRLQNKINRIIEIRKVQDKMGQEFDSEFNSLFTEFLYKKFNINNGDIQELYDEIDKQNDLDGDIKVQIIDKFYNTINSKLDFDKKCSGLFNRKTYEYVPSKNKNIHNDDFVINY